MSSYKFFCFVLFSIILLSGCQTQKKDSVEKPNQVTIDKTDSTESDQKIEDKGRQNIVDEREPTDDEIRELGKIVNIEDGVYPMFIVTIDFPERKMKMNFDLNIESISMDAGSLNELNGKYVKFYYTSELEQNLYDIHAGGSSLLGEYAPEKDPNMKEITGTLSGAESESGGDLPDKISVTDNNGKKIIFKYYITPEMVTANGKTVTAYYSARGVQTITYLHPSEG